MILKLICNLFVTIVYYLCYRYHGREPKPRGNGIIMEIKEYQINELFGDDELKFPISSSDIDDDADDWDWDDDDDDDDD